jgi:predicted outer membrane repeat protein
MKHRLLLFTFLISCIYLKAQTVRYVNTTPSGTADGSSWANASNNLQGMINASAPGDEVWVAEGSYVTGVLPPFCGTGCNFRDATFFVKVGVSLYGGFAGNESSKNERTGNNETILTGDFNNDDIITGTGSTLTITNNGENAYHVVVIEPNASGTPATTAIDGFTIKGGNANSGNPIVNSGIFYNRNLGGAIYLDTQQSSGFTGLNLNINNVNFIGNSSTDRGGAIYAFIRRTSICNITNSFFENNLAFPSGNGERGGGAVYSEVFAADGSEVNYFGNTFLGNRVRVSGFAQGYGGAIYCINSNSTTRFHNNIFANNSTVQAGGAVFSRQETLSTFEYFNNTFYANSCGGTFAGGAISGANIFNNGLHVYKNNIFWENSNGNGTQDVFSGIWVQGPNSGHDFTHNLVHPNSLFASNTGVIVNQDPIFVDVNANNFNLDCGSPAIDMGTAASAPTTDINGLIRPQGAAHDMGAYEYVSTLDNSVSLSGNILTASVSGVSYQWIDCDNANTPISGETNQSFTATQNGNYAVIITENSCETISDCIEVNSLSVEGIDLIGFKLHPNPFSDAITIQLPMGVEKASVSILNMDGKVVYKTQINRNQSSINQLHSLAKGLYLMQVSLENGQTITKKLIK